MSNERSLFKRKARPRLQRYFLEWLTLHNERFAYPLILRFRTERVMTFTLEGITPSLEITLTHEIGVHAIKNAEWWDALLFFEASPLKTKEGYICRWCKPESIKSYPTREALWSDHMFEPFLAWVNQTLPNMQWLGLSQTECGGARWADLHAEWREPADEYEKWVPLRPKNRRTT